MLKGAHITVNARTEEEVETELIVEKLSKSTGSAYSFREKTEIIKDSGPVVSNIILNFQIILSTSVKFIANFLKHFF